MTQDMNHTFGKALRVMVVAAMTLLAGSTATAQVHVSGNVYGGGNLAAVGGSVTVNIKAGTVDKDVYGGGALANTNINNATNYGTSSEAISSTSTNTTTVNLLGGEIHGDAYGGGLGQFGTEIIGEKYTQEEIDAAQEGDDAYGKTIDDWKVEPVAASEGVGAVKAMVYGDVYVTLGSETGTSATAFYIDHYTGDHAGVVKSGRVFGCNNLNGSPLGNVTVTVWKTVEGNTPRSTTADKSNADATYELAAVYGGGNLANYTVTGKKTHVIINGCAIPSIEYVYGGGNAAAVPQASVDINAAYEIGYVFGGGNGKDDYTLDGDTWITNPGANVNGNATTMLFGGTIHEAFGGSNEKGSITGSVSINSQKGVPGSANYCALSLGKLYGAGKNADIDGDLIVVMGCMPGDDDPTTEVYGGAENANVKGNVELTITSGSFGKVFGGNNTSGAIFGHIKLNIEETGCCPIKIDELYLGGYNAPYSVYGYYEDGTIEGTEKPKYVARQSASDTHTAVYFGDGTNNDHTKAPYADPELNVISCTYIGKVFGGGLGVPATMYANPTVNINMIQGAFANSIPSATDNPNKLGEIGTVYGGGNAADVVGDPTVNIGTAATVDLVSTSTTGNTVKGAYITGNVFGGGMGKDDTFTCEKAMVGKEGDGINNPDGGTTVNIGNGIVICNVYGGGEIGRVEKNTVVTIGLTSGTGTPIIKGDVFGGGKGLETHGYAALVRGNPTVTIQGNAKVLHSVYGGGEIASVARYQVVGGVPVALAGEEGNYSGYCTVNVLGNAIIGPDEKMVMHHVDAQGNTVNGSDGFPLLPDDAGHVFAAGKGVLPKIYTYGDNDNRPKRMMAYDDSKFNSSNSDYWAYSDDSHQNVWQYFKDESEYFEFIQTLALATQTEVTISGNAFVKGSVYGGSENGLVQYDTHVTIEGGQIGCGKNTTDRHPDEVWGDTYTVPENTDLECASWEYDPSSGAPYDPYAKYLNDGDGKYYYDGAHTKYAEGGSIVAKDGHTYYGNVFGGGSGSVPYYDSQQGISRYIPTAGEVKGNTYVTISGGHILTNVYGGNEATNVLGAAHVTMTGGTIGVPRTAQQIKDHPVTCYLFGAGKGDQRIFFNKETNVNDAIVKVEGGRIYGSVFGGGEDGHVLRNTEVTIGKADGTVPKIGTVGSTYVDGNVFGGGRGFSGEALTAGNVGGSVALTINGGEMLGSIYGGGRLASVGYGLYLTTETGYGEMRDDKEYDGSYPNPSPDDAETFYNKGRGHIIVTINGGTIGKEFESDVEGEHSGNVFGGSMGRLTKLDGSSFDDSKHWSLLATAKSTTVNINGGTIKRSVYGGGEMGTVTTDAIVNVSGGTIGTSGKGGAEFGNVYGGGKGYVDPAGSNYVTAGIIKGNTKVIVENGTNTTPTIYHNIYGGGAYGSVGTFTYDENNNVITGYTSGGKAEIYVTGGTIGTDGKENGMIFGSSRGDVGAPNSIHDKLAWVYDTHVAIGDTTATATTTETPLIKGSVYGGGENGHNYRNAYVRINGGTIGINNNETITYKDDPNDADKVTYTGKDYNYPYRGNVYGGGCGTDKYYSTGTELHDGNGDTYNPKAGIVQGNAIVHVTAGNIVHNVYGAGAMGSVGTMTKDNDDHLDISSGGKTTIEISGGTVGVDGTDNGNVFGAARGDETTKQTDVALVKTTDVTISGDADATVVWGNVYGGGQIGCVGTFTERADDGKYIWTSDAQNLNGLTKVSITGGETKGHVFGAGKGKAVTFKCEKAMVKKTQVSVSNGKVDKNVYGGGEIGRVEEDTEVKIGVGDGTCTPTISGSVYGAGAGLETHGYSALVRHNTTVTVEGGATIGQSVYGGGEIASVGRYGLDDHKMPEILLDGGYCYVTVKGSATIGSTTVEGNVFGACKGVVPHLGDKDDTDKTKRPRRMTVYTNATDFPEGAKIDATTGNASGTTSTGTTWEYYDENAKLVWEYFRTEEAYDTYLQTLALATHPEVTIDGGATVNGSVYGGGEMGLTKGSVMVNILGGTITEDVYGGGALANTNTTSAVGVLDNAGIPQKKTNGQYQTTTVYPKTTVNLLGGKIVHDAYGGGLGDDTHAPKVKGDVLVELNNNNHGGTAIGTQTGCVVDRIFGCNNLNGTPTKKVQVKVYATQKDGGENLFDKTTGSYDVRAVYGGGNLSPYEPDDALWEDPEDYAANKAKVDAARPEVTIDGCALTSIETVYGGGNAAPVPATYVVVERCYEINEVFGGGNGYDNYSKMEGENIVWYKNPGANVGYYTYFTYPKDESHGTGVDEAHAYEAVVIDEDFSEDVEPQDRYKANRLAAYDIQYGSGIATLVVKGGTVHTTYGGSNSKGNVRKLLSSTLSAMNTDCPMNVGQSYGGGKDAYSDADSDVKAECAKGVREMFGGSKNADFNGNVNMLITNGSSLERVFGGNNTSGAVNGSITITIEEGGCEPIIIKDLYLGGFLAPYSVYGYESEKEEVKDKDGNVIVDDNGDPILQRKLKTSGRRLYQDPRIYIISATQIENVYGGGYQAKLVGNPHINVNMTRGKVEVTRNVSGETVTYTDINDNSYATDITEEDGQYYAYLPIGTIGNIYGGGNMADIVGDTHVEIGTGKWHNGDDVLETEDVDGNKWTYNATTKEWTKSTYDEATQTWIETSQADAPAPARYAAKITGNVYGGGNLADVTGNTYVDICAYEVDDPATTDVIEYKGVAIDDSGLEAVTISGNVFGGGKGKADSFRCPKAMVGVENTNNGDIDITTEVTSDGTSKGTRVSIGNGTVEGSVYGGGQIGRVEWNTVVTIGLPVESGKSKPVIRQNVFGAGKGVEQYGYAALVRGNTFVTIQADAKVGHSVYGGGEIASVGKYNVVGGVPTSLANQGSGYCNVTVKGNAEIGPDDMQMYHADSDGNIPADDKPDDWGHVFGAGKGILPYEDKDHFECQDPAHQDSEGHGLKHPGSMKPGADPIDPADDVWICYEGNEAGYLEFVETQALATQTEVIIGGNAFVKGSVYGGSENGHVQHGTHVTIEGDCQIGAGFDPLTKKSKAKYTGWPTETENISDSWAECAHWDYDLSSGAPYDKYAIYERDGKSYYYDSNITTYHNNDDGKDYADEAYTLPIYAEGGAKIAKDGHTYYGNVFGGGSGSIPYAPGKWHRAAGSVGGNTVVDITGGHILTSVYGGNEQTDVGTYKKDANGNITTTPEDEDEAKGLPGGKCTVNMMGGTIGVPRTEADAKAHPVTCYLFGAGKGDQRIFFNTWTNVINTEVNISGEARIYGSTFGGGEDGHIINNAVTNIGGTMTIGGKNYTPTNKLIIGTTGTSYVDGNVFGGGRGFSGDAQTAGTVGGNIEVNIYNGKMLGSIYGGGRLASVGTQFTSPTDPNYGNFLEDGNGKSYGHVIVNISGGTIGRDFVKDDAGNLPAGAEHSGNVFGGSMGRLTLLNGDINPIWPKMAQVKTSAVNVYGTAVIKRNVFGGGELGTVRDNASVVIGGYLNPRVSDGCKSDFIFNPSKSDSTITVSASANAPIVYRDVYGGGYGSQDFETKTKITVKMPKDGVTNPTSASDYMDVSYVFTPMVFAGCVGQHTFVNIAGGMVRKSVYGGGEMASVGILDCRVDENGNYINVHSHLEGDDGFALSWPYHFENAPGYFGATHVKVTGGRIGVADGDDDINTDNGDVYGGGKGIAGDYKNYVFCANVGSTDVTIKYPEENNATPQTYMSNETIECIAGAVYGGAENGHVMGDANLTIENGLIGHSVYGGGSGKGTFTKWLTKIPEDRRTVVTSGGSGTPPETNESGEYKAECYSITAGKVFGNTNVVMNGGYVVRNVYGGGNMGSVGKGNYSGGADDYSKAGYGETLTGNLWDGGSDGGSRFSQAFLSSGKCTVKITGGTVGYIGYDANDPLKYVYPRDLNTGLPYGNVFGGCRGESAPNILEHPRYLYCPEFFLGYVNETDVTIGKSEDGTGPTILGSVYGGGMDGHVRRDTKVTIYGGEIGSEYTTEECTKVGTSDLNDIMWLHRGNVYGAGSGIGKYKYDFNYDGDFGDVIDYKRPGATTTTRMKEEDYSTSAGSVTRFTKVEVKGGKIHRNVYGGGSLSSIGGPKIPPIDYDPYRKGDTESGHGEGLQSQNEVIISGSTTIIGDATSYDANGNHVYGGHVFGASRGDETLSNPTSFASSSWTDVKVQGGTIYGDVYGGGEVGTVRQGTEVHLTGGVIGSVKGSEVVGGDVFGGGKGTSTVAADVGGNVLVELNKGVAETDPGCVVDRIFGANNVNGTPKGHVTVHVYATQNRNLTAYPNIKAKKENVTSPEPPASDFDMTGVFGGGKSSDYVPAESDTKQSTEVIIEGCSLTSIYEVYGGGYGASTPGTDVLINGTKIIDKVFGGGYGAGEHENKTAPDYNPGANVGSRTDGTPYGLHLDPNDETKIAIVQLKAGKVNSVFGGSNSKGNIRNGASITTLTSEETETQTDDPCEILEVGELYGGGNEAVMEGGAEVVLRCMPDSWIGEVYAGARKADVGNDVSLTITSGKFEKVFGGNKTDGKIDGYVEVNIEECPTCNTPVIIGELYGGGNMAPYTYPELADDPNYQSPRVNVRAFTSIGTIYGGGKGADAVVTGNPTVYVSVGMVDGGGQKFLGDTKTIDGKPVKLYAHDKDKIGVIGDVFGGGNAAVVNGNTNVFIGTEKFVKLDRIVAGETDVSNYYIRTGTSPNYQYDPVEKSYATAGVTYYQRNPSGTYTEVSVEAGADVSGYYTRSGEEGSYVYTPVNAAEEGKVYCLRVEGVDIRGNVYGGGNAAKVTGNTNVVVGKKTEE